MKPLKLLLFICLLPNLVYANDELRKVSVTGKSEITLDAQYSIINFELKFVRKDIDQSYQGLQQTLATVVGNLKKIGLSDKEITKSIIRQGSEYSWQNNSRVHIGYYSSSSVRLRVNDIDKIHVVYNELSKYDSLTIHSTEYGRNDEFERRNEEFRKALLAAKEKAEFMAGTLNASVGPVIRIQEESVGNFFTGSVYRNQAESDQVGGTFGAVAITATVKVDFELK